MHEADLADDDLLIFISCNFPSSARQFINRKKAIKEESPSNFEVNCGTMGQ